MIKYISLVLILFTFEISLAHACEFHSVIRSEILPDGGSIRLELKTNCATPSVVDYSLSLQNDKHLSVDDSPVLTGSGAESNFLQRLDRLVQRRIQKKSLRAIQEIEMQRFVGGNKATLTPVFGLIESLCAASDTKSNNKDICRKYSPERLKQ